MFQNFHCEYYSKGRTVTRHPAPLAYGMAYALDIVLEIYFYFDIYFNFTTAYETVEGTAPQPALVIGQHCMTACA